MKYRATMRERSREFTSILNGKQIALSEVPWYYEEASRSWMLVVAQRKSRLQRECWMLDTGYWMLDSEYWSKIPRQDTVSEFR